MENKTNNHRGHIVSVFFVALFLSMLLVLNMYASYCTEQEALGKSCIFMPSAKYPLNITFTECVVDDDCAVYILGDNRNIKNASVVVSGIINIQGHTGDDGKFKFSPDNAGNIKITAEKDGYYKAEGGFSIKKSTNINIEIPDNIETNKEISIIVKNSKGKSIKTNIAIVTPDEKISNVKTDKDGNAKFTPPTPGKYKIIIDDRNYKGEKEFVALGKLNIVCHDVVKFMDKFTINVVDENNNTIDVQIKILELNKEINNREEVVAEKCGNLNLVAEKECYEKAAKTISVENKKLNLTGKDKLNAKKAYLYSVKDEDGNVVEDVRILINGSFVGTTDIGGNITIKIENAGNYIISAKKECYDDSTLSVEVTEFSLMLLWLLWLLLLLLLILLLLFLWRKYKSKEIKSTPAGVMTPFGMITKSVKIVKKEGLEIPGASQEQRIYVYLIAEKDMKNCKLVDNISARFDVNVMTLGVERSENKLTLNLGDVTKGDVRVLNYLVNGICEIENAKIVYGGEELNIPIRYV
ncbi:MAG: hypothetical protein QMD06_01410 [Candidatus Altarchaeum sp.]|nr:hypothetical protein [Candidatus Altarchaeum sp.]